MTVGVVVQPHSPRLPRWYQTLIAHVVLVVGSSSVKQVYWMCLMSRRFVDSRCYYINISYSIRIIWPAWTACKAASLNQRQSQHLSISQNHPLTSLLSHFFSKNITVWGASSCAAPSFSWPCQTWTTHRCSGWWTSAPVSWTRAMQGRSARSRPCCAAVAGLVGSGLGGFPWANSVFFWDFTWLPDRTWSNHRKWGYDWWCQPPELETPNGCSIEYHLSIRWNHYFGRYHPNE